MNYYFKLLLPIVLITGICFCQTPKKKIQKEQNTETIDPFMKEWMGEYKSIKNPESQKLIEGLKLDFQQERDILKKEFKKKESNLRDIYSQKRKELIKKFHNENPQKRKPKKIRKSKTQQPKNVKTDINNKEDKPKPKPKNDSNSEKKKIPENNLKK